MCHEIIESSSFASRSPLTHDVQFWMLIPHRRSNALCPMVFITAARFPSLVACEPIKSCRPQYTNRVPRQAGFVSSLAKQLALLSAAGNQSPAVVLCPFRLGSCEQEFLPIWRVVPCSEGSMSCLLDPYLRTMSSSDIQSATVMIVAMAKLALYQMNKKPKI